jgi:hypothetical protein
LSLSVASFLKVINEIKKRRALLFEEGKDLIGKPVVSV